jgi:uncharacterized protein YciI
MKFFLVELNYKAELPQIEAATPAHREFLQTGYDRGVLLCSGPKVPRTGGLIIARSDSLEAAQAFFASDPFQKQGLADYRFVEFNPVKRAGFAEDWFAATSL